MMCMGRRQRGDPTSAGSDYATPIHDRQHRAVHCIRTDH